MSSFNTTLERIYSHMGKKDYNQVITQCNELFISNPQRSEALTVLLNVYATLNDSEKTIEGLKMLIKQLPMTNIPPQSIPSYCILYNSLAETYSIDNNYTMSVECYKKIISLNNSISAIYNNLAICYIKLREYKHAIISLQLSLRLEKQDVTYSILGSAQLYIKKYKESIRNYESIKNPDTEQLYNMCFPYLASKQFIKGYELYENRLVENRICPQTNQISRVQIPSVPYWDGKVSCKHLMIVYEQGIGDNIQYFRFIIELTKRYPKLKITYFCKNVVSHLFNTDSYENITIIDDSNPVDLSIYNAKLYIMSLPYILKLQMIIPNDIDYIIRDKENDEKWYNKMLPFNDKLKVGFMYSGLLISYIDKHIELNDFKNICCDENIQAICLHKMDDKIKDDFSKIDFASEIFVDDIDMNKAFTDTISILRNIDVLVTIDTSIAHLAGVMGIKTLLLIGYTSEWRWFDNDDKVWYESVDIIRMTEQKPLHNLMPRVKELLDAEYVNKQLD